MGLINSLFGYLKLATYWSDKITNTHTVSSAPMYLDVCIPCPVDMAVAWDKTTE